MRRHIFLFPLLMLFALFFARTASAGIYDIFYNPYTVEPDTTKVIYPVPVNTGNPFENLNNQSPLYLSDPDNFTITTRPPRSRKANTLITRTRRESKNTGKNVADRTRVPPPTAAPSSRLSTSEARPSRPSSAATPSTSVPKAPSTSPSASSTATATTPR